jgi:hypothetical protein
MSTLATVFDPPVGAGPEELRARLRALADLLTRAPVPIAVAHDAAASFRPTTRSRVCSASPPT